MRIIEVIADCGHADTIRGIADQHEILECWVVTTDVESRCSTRMLVQPEKQQEVLDAIQIVLDKVEGARVILIPVEGILPRPEPEDPDDIKKRAVTRSREELYQRISTGSHLDSNFTYLVVLSTVVAAIGLLVDSVAVVIGAMVIAPLLGPNIAFAFGTAIGETSLIWSALKTNITGLLLAVFVSGMIGLIWPNPLDTSELMSRTDVGVDGIVLALASGAAAVISLVAGWTTSLVGVMVAVALLPPTATLGLMLGAGNYHAALGAGLLLAVNIVCVNLSAKLAFVLKGIKPRTWLEKKKARQSLSVYVIFWIVTLIVLVIAMQLRDLYL